MGIFHKVLGGSRGTKFVHIGANDGKTGDPIWKYVKRDKWRGVFVEPISSMFEKLKKNYEGDRGYEFLCRQQEVYVA